MFCLDEKVIYPGHGVAKINRLIKKQVSGKEVTFYELTFLSKEVTVLVPTDNAKLIGLRALSASEEIKNAFNKLKFSLKKSNKNEFVSINWNKRNKEYQLKLRSGSFPDLLEIYKDLRYLSSYKELSFGEKNLLQQTETLLVEEISIVEDMAYEKVVEQLRLLCSSHMNNSSINNVTLFENIEETLV